MDDHLTIISGASSGIGAALAEHAADAGHTVATVSRRPGPGTHLAADLSDPGSWPTMIDWIRGLVGEREWQRVVFVHNAGTLEPMGFAGEVDLAAYTDNVLLNSASTQVLGSGFVEVMAPTGVRALLMVISSGAGKSPYPGWSSYCAGKAAADMWVRVVGGEQRDRGSAISVVSIAPGVVATDMQAQIREQSAEEFPNVERFREMHSEGQLASPHDVAAVLFDLARQDADGRTHDGVALDNGAVLDIRDFDRA